MTENNEIILPEDYDALEKGKKYVVYITDNSLSGDLYIMSASNGRVKIDDFKNHIYKDIALRSILMVEGIEIPLDVELKYSEKKNNKNDVTMNLKKTGLKANVYTDPLTNTQTIEVGDIYVEASSPVIVE